MRPTKAPGRPQGSFRHRRALAMALGRLAVHCCARFAVAGVVLLLAACGSEQQGSVTPGPTSDAAAGFFPVTVVVETDKAWLTVRSVTRVNEPVSESEATLVIEGSVKVIRTGRFDYRLTLTDSEGASYEDSGGVLLGQHREGETPLYETSITVPGDATLTELGFWLAGGDEPELSYLIDLPVAAIPVRSP